MTRTPSENHTENCRAAVMEGLAATLPQWSAASPEQKKSSDSPGPTGQTTLLGDDLASHGRPEHPGPSIGQCSNG